MPIKQINTSDKNLQLIQDATAAVVDPIEAKPIVQGLLLRGLVLKTGQDNNVPHTLGRQLVMWLLAGINAAATVYEFKAADSKFLYLRCSADCTVNMWVA